jgi:hypothetical protein
MDKGNSGNEGREILKSGLFIFLWMPVTGCLMAGAGFLIFWLIGLTGFRQPLLIGVVWLGGMLSMIPLGISLTGRLLGVKKTGSGRLPEIEGRHSTDFYDPPR